MQIILFKNGFYVCDSIYLAVIKLLEPHMSDSRMCG